MTTRNWFYSLSVLVIIMSLIDIEDRFGKIIEGLVLAFWAVYAIKMVIENAISTFSKEFSLHNHNNYEINLKINADELDKQVAVKIDQAIKKAVRGKNGTVIVKVKK